MRQLQDDWDYLRVVWLHDSQQPVGMVADDDAMTSYETDSPPLHIRSSVSAMRSWQRGNVGDGKGFGKLGCWDHIQKGHGYWRVSWHVLPLQCCKYFAAKDNMVSQYAWLETDFETTSEPKNQWRKEVFLYVVPECLRPTPSKQTDCMSIRQHWSIAQLHFYSNKAVTKKSCLWTLGLSSPWALGKLKALAAARAFSLRVHSAVNAATMGPNENCNPTNHLLPLASWV